MQINTVPIAFPIQMFFLKFFFKGPFFNLIIIILTILSDGVFLQFVRCSFFLSIEIHFFQGVRRNALQPFLASLSFLGIVMVVCCLDGFVVLIIYCRFEFVFFLIWFFMFMNLIFSPPFNQLNFFVSPIISLIVFHLKFNISFHSFGFLSLVDVLVFPLKI